MDPAKKSYENGEIVTAIATAKEGYKFVNWTVASKVVSDKAEYKFKRLTSRWSCKQAFVKVSEDPKPENQDEDKAVQTGRQRRITDHSACRVDVSGRSSSRTLRKKED